MQIKHMLSVAVAVALCFTTNDSAADCSANNWKGCKGKPWVDGDTMETPLGSKWWPHPIWGSGDEAGSTNWYTKPAVVLRAFTMVKEGKAIKIGTIIHPTCRFLEPENSVCASPATRPADRLALVKYFTTTSSYPRKSGKSAHNSMGWAILACR